MNSLTDFEDVMSLQSDIKSKPTRWEVKYQLDRFIPNRVHTENQDLTSVSLNNTPTSTAAEILFAHTIGSNKRRVLSFRERAPTACAEYIHPLKILYSCNVRRSVAPVKSERPISDVPIRILDAPGLADDYYLNLLTWNKSGSLAVALSRSVFLWDPVSVTTAELLHLNNESDYVSSVAWIPDGSSHLAVGTAECAVQLWDAHAQQQVRRLDGHSGRVGTLAWNQHLLTSGSADGTVINHDVRVRDHVVGKMACHAQEVCGLAWSHDGAYLASGGNDNRLCLTESRSFHSLHATPRHVLTEHHAAVKALAWSPHERHLLASGGGTADRCIKFWNAASGSLVNSVDTGSQVCALQWSPFEKEILSSHGYAENQLCLWKYPTMAKVKELRGHTSRVLHMAVSPNGATVCSGAADETLCFWDVFASSGKARGKNAFAGTGACLSAASSLTIR